jgi:hypothetical protein
MDTHPGVESQFNQMLPHYPVTEGCVTVPEPVEKYQIEN